MMNIKTITALTSLSCLLGACLETTDVETDEPDVAEAAPAVEPGDTASADAGEKVVRSMVRGPDGKLREMEVLVRNGKAFIEGDIYLGPAARLVPPGEEANRSNVLAVASDLWPSHVIPYYIDTSTVGPTGVARINAALDIWRNQTVFEFVVRTDQTDYLEFVASDTGCYSAIGRAGWGQNINIENGVCTTGNVVHEIGHALGLYHEQVRSDRGTYLSYLADNVEFGKGANFTVEGTKYGAFDWGSVMLYDTFAFTTNGNPTLQRKDVWSWRRSGMNNWGDLRTAEGKPLKEAKFGDFNGDNLIDALKLIGEDWYIASKVTGGWQKHSTLPSSSSVHVAVGQFDRDPREDLFRADGTGWYYSSGGNGAWVKINASTYQNYALLYGDFNGDGLTDVLRPDGTRWNVSWSGRSDWDTLNTSGYSYDKIAIGNFDSGAGDDILITTGTEWKLSSGGQSVAQTINTSSYLAKDLIFGNFVGDKRTDVVRQKGKFGYDVVTSGLGDWAQLVGTGSGGTPGKGYVRVVDVDSDGLDDMLTQGVYFAQRAGLSPDDVTAIHNLYFGSWQWSKSGMAAFQYRGMSNTPMSAVRFADFNNDNRDDVFRTDGSRWLVAYAGQGDWVQLNASGYTLADIALGDFDGNGRADVFRADGSRWWISYNGTGAWTQVNSSGYDLDALKFADMNGDGRTDVFLATGTTWYYSPSATGAWIKLADSGVTNVALADFNADKKADVFYATGTAWQVAYGGLPGWHVINSSGYTLDKLRLGDFNGDGRADVMRADGTNWYVSFAGTAPWLVLNISGYLLPALGLGDLDGDNRTDIMVQFPRFAN